MERKLKEKAMKTKIMTILVVVKLLIVSQVQAIDVDIYSDTVIQEGDYYDTVVNVYDTPPDHTTVDMTGGFVHVPHGASIAACLPHIIRLSYDADAESFAELAVDLDPSSRDLPTDQRAERSADSADEKAKQDAHHHPVADIHKASFKCRDHRYLR